MNTITELLQSAVIKFGEKTAFEDKDGSISFAELQKQAQSIAAALLNQVETGRTKPIIVYMEKSIKSIVSFIGIMYAASPYVPLDYLIPLNRFEKTAENLNPTAVITDAAGAEKLKEINISAKILIYDEIINTMPDIEAIKAIQKSELCDLDPAYIMYTSGSTGTPKGVTVTHRGVLDYIQWIEKTFPINNSSIIGMQSAFHFDNSIFDMFVPMLTGAKTIIIPEILFMYPEKLTDFLVQSKISVIFWVPTVMISAADSGIPYLPDMKLIMFAGEVMPNKQLNIWRSALPNCMYVNMYGPTEATDIATYYIVDREYKNHETLPIGKPCANMRALILNDKNEECRINEHGELCLLGSGIALGYWNDIALTEKAFVQNPLNSKYDEIMYRTGDLVYKNDEGNIIFLGRHDSQIKLRGNRIELGDIESAATAIDGIRNSCALFDTDKQEIILFLETNEEIKERKFKLLLKQFIPSYMTPSKIITTAEFPHTPSGKIDRVKLRKDLNLS
jgi:amino acid adenylation domain-containing protein